MADNMGIVRKKYSPIKNNSPTHIKDDRRRFENQFVDAPFEGFICEDSRWFQKNTKQLQLAPMFVNWLSFSYSLINVNLQFLASKSECENTFKIFKCAKEALPKVFEQMVSVSGGKKNTTTTSKPSLVQKCLIIILMSGKSRRNSTKLLH